MRGAAMSAFSDQMNELAKATTQTLDDLIPEVASARGRVSEAMRYACFAGGKRLRPLLVVSTADLFDVPRGQSLRAAAALEMIHSYSLIHDDLPAMDDSDLRRGRPSTHKQFDEATAILAGDALLTQAFEVMGHPDTQPDPQVRADLVVGLAKASGVEGMVGGQMIDILGEGKSLTLAEITELQALKTGALIKFSCLAGAILGRADTEVQERITAYADDLGLAFQIVDDLLDAFGSEEDLGKPTGQDDEMDKATFVRLLGADGARAKAEELVERAVDRMAIFGDKSQPLQDVARFVLKRSS